MRHAGVEVIIERVPGRPVEVLRQAAKDADLLVLSFRALGAADGFALGSVGLFAVARADAAVDRSRPHPRAVRH
ncbi:universal stress protein [Streptomyces thermoalcalitolerans]|uniref:universal stress protein n=1 Tax=Streptomyces thermoalcalitolerans TaxID=65605 RepID=UPI0031DE83E8